ncbi:2-oxoglutarate (2OG) and Fe(II)-dependent oxygenase superfamily protein [Thalictrum thalictroides]|uniref:2-oxoglutarate (2OG) and Fe(II)-dependent oxygenase superfamily protein n=1 Tax=Thalictrum thalictroides TaxID=46969 RepID=A0A7J6WLW1_THATH|nr:2-oxoglutarate (2OG) and Fe(II)-dependent oxygenase superfamily protein [Thalictrum thalictroides]
MFRLNKYRPPKENETNLGMNEHTDSGFITVFSQSDVNGFEIQTKDGEWISVTPSTASLIVFVGDGLFAWSNARLHSPLH